MACTLILGGARSGKSALAERLAQESGREVTYVATSRAGDLLGPWAVSGPAQSIALAALNDTAWQATTRARLDLAGRRMGDLLRAHGIVAGGTPLFHWWPHAEPEAFHEHLAQRGIWCRLFVNAARGIRLGLPANEEAWLRLARALDEWRER